MTYLLFQQWKKGRSIFNVEIYPRFMMYFTYHDLKVHTDQIAIQNRRAGGQFLTLKFEPIFMVYITFLYFKVKNGEMAYLLFQRRRMVKEEKEGCQFSTLKFDIVYNDLLVI